MGNCRSLLPSASQGNTAGTYNHSGSSQFVASFSNTRRLRDYDSTSLGHSSHSGGISQLFGPSSSTSSNNFTTSSNTSTSLWGSDHSHTATRPRDEEEEFPNGQVLDAANLRVFTLPELKAATRNFRADRVVGEGGFGKVYKGLLKERAARNRGHELPIAIKKWNSNSFQGVAEWKTEIHFLGSLSHPNLVKLLGFRGEDGELFLVYEYMHCGTLENHLFGRGATVRPLSWDKRLKVMIGAARGLAFLHSLDKKIILRDVKPSNILLDMSYTAKLSDFGLAKFGPSADKTHVSTRVMGTYGHAAPEYIATGHLYVKSDVYGFGIVLMETLTGKRMRDITCLNQKSSLLDWLKSNMFNRGKMRSTMDARLEGRYPPNLALKVAQLAYKCLGADPKVRPSMKEVVETLEQIEAANEKPADKGRRVTRSRAVQQHGRPDDG